MPQGFAGVLLIALFWPLNWMLPGVRTSYLFFPLWLGYILTVDGIVAARRGDSILTRSRSGFIRLFLASAPAWWLFEIINRRTNNWEYLGGERFTGFEYFVLATISFSTVMPAVFETAELIGTTRWIVRFTRGPQIRPTSRVCAAMFGCGCFMFALVLLFPKYCYPLVWGALVLMIEPVNVRLNRAAFFSDLNRGDWRSVVALATGSLVCGFFWEMWNMYSYPKWIYHTPGAEYLHIFEMPLLGYLGYLPFAWELMALRNLVWPGAPSLIMDEQRIKG
jgi:hypothetical protein